MERMKKNAFLLSGLMAGALALAVCGCGSEERADEAGFAPLRRVAYTSETAVEMKPSQAELEGACGGYFFIPMDGMTYRYQVNSGFTDDVTEGELIYECSETGIYENYEWKIYSLKEYPEHEVLLGEVSGGERVLLAHAPAAGVSEADMTDAWENGFVIMKDGSVIHGKEMWSDFCEKAQAGEPCSIRLGYYYTNEKVNMTEELREATKEDYPALYLEELCFDGTQYRINPVNKVEDEYVVYERADEDPSYNDTFQYLMHYTGEAPTADALFTSYDKYVLTNDNTVTWQDLISSMASSQFGAYIPHHEVFSEYEWK